MVELRGLLPVEHVVTALAIVTELPFMRIGVAGQTVRRQSKKRLGEILDLDELPLTRNHLRRGVAFFAGQACVFSLQVVSRLAMVELLLRRLPVNQAEVLPIVIQVAAYAVLALGICHTQSGMVTVIQGEPLRYFLVTIEAFKGGSAGAKLMAAGALRGSA